jgi:two-component system chemotaxis response regulator CheY
LDGAGGFAVKQLHILVVEDDFISRNLLVRMVQRYGAIDSAVNGIEALKAVETAHEAHNPYDLIFLDIMMPMMDGQAALRQIRSFEQEHGVLPPDGSKIVMLTALGDATNVMQAFRGQCEGYVTKPYTLQTIEAQMKAIGLISTAN